MPPALLAEAVDIGVGHGVVTRPATLTSRHPATAPTCLGRSRARPYSLAPYLLTKALRESGRNQPGHTVWQLLPEDRQRGPDGAFNVTSSAHLRAGLDLTDELVVAHRFLLTSLNGEHRPARRSAGRPVLFRFRELHLLSRGVS